MDSWVDQSHYTHVARDSNGNPYLGVFTFDSTSSSTPSASLTSHQPHPQTLLFECYGDTFRTFQYNAQTTDAEYNLFLLTPARRTLTPEREHNVAQASASSSASSSTSFSSDSEVFQSDSDDSMSSTELHDTLRQANQDLHTSDEITAPPSMLKYIDVIVYRFYVTTHHPIQW